MFSSFRYGQKRIYMADLDKLRSTVPPPDFEVSAGSAAVTAGISQTPRGVQKQNRLRVSTDFFLPVVFYSSLDGFYSAFLWQASDFMGNHQFQAVAASAGGIGYLDYQLSYAYLRYRPQLSLNLTGDEYYVDTEKTDRKIENSQSAAVQYPLNRFQQLQLQLTTVDRKEIVALGPFETSARSRENSALFSFVHNKVDGPYLEAVSGSRLSLQSEFSAEVFGGSYIYQNYMAELDKFFPLGKEHVLGVRMLAGASYGRDAGLFRLGGADRVRGIPNDPSFYGKRLFLTNIEWRLPIFHNLNYHMWYMFPDFFFKTLYAGLFVDGGVVYNEDIELKNLTIDRWKGSYGLSLRFHTFIIETYDLLLNFQLAQRMDLPGWVFYFSAGTNF